MKRIIFLLLFCGSLFAQRGIVTIRPLNKNTVKYITAISTINVPTNLQKQAVNKFVIDLLTLNQKQANLIVFGCAACSGIKGIYPVLGNDSVCDKINLLNPVDADTAYRLTTLTIGTLATHKSSTTFHNPSELCGMTTGQQWFATHYTLSATDRNNFSMCVYLPVSGTSSTNSFMGADATEVGYAPAYNGTTFYYRITSSAAAFAQKANTSQQGLWLGNRINSAYITMDKNSAAWDSSAVASVSPTGALKCAGGNGANTSWGGYFMYYSFGVGLANYNVRYAYMQAINNMNTILIRNKY
jgi:hypothetical protein